MNFFYAVNATPAISQGGGGIVTADLLAHLDAANAASYPGSGTLWYDLVNSYNVSLLNGAAYNALGGGSIRFDGVNDYGRNTTFAWGALTSWSVEGWVYATKTGGDGTFFGAQWALPTNYGGLFYLDVGDGAYGYDCVFYQTDGLVVRTGFTDPNAVANLWQHVVFVGDGVNKEVRLYVDNVHRGTGYLTSGTNFRYSATAGFAVGSERSTAAARLFGGYVAQVRIYSVPFTATEVAQNWNATRANFGR